MTELLAHPVNVFAKLPADQYADLPTETVGGVVARDLRAQRDQARDLAVHLEQQLAALLPLVPEHRPYPSGVTASKWERQHAGKCATCPDAYWPCYPSRVIEQVKAGLR